MSSPIASSFSSGLSGTVKPGKKFDWSPRAESYVRQNRNLRPADATRALKFAQEAFVSSADKGGTFEELDQALAAEVATLIAAARRAMAPAPACQADDPSDPALRQFRERGILIRLVENPGMLTTCVDSIPPAGTSQAELKKRKFSLEKTSLIHPTSTMKGFQDRRVGLLISLESSWDRVLAD